MTEQEETTAILESAAVLADKLGLKRVEDNFTLVEGQTVLVASKFGMEFGKVKVDERITGRFHVTEYFLNGEEFVLILKKVLEHGNLEPFKWQGFSPDNAVIYIGE